LITGVSIISAKIGILKVLQLKFNLE